MMRRLRWRRWDPHQDPALVSRRTGLGAGLVTAILAANPLLPTTRPVRRRSVALPGNQELIWLKAGLGSRQGKPASADLVTTARAVHCPVGSPRSSAPTTNQRRERR